MELRFIIRDGKKILQLRNKYNVGTISSQYLPKWTEWKDVPLVEDKV